MNIDTEQEMADRRQDKRDNRVDTGMAISAAACPPSFEDRSSAAVALPSSCRILRYQQRRNLELRTEPSTRATSLVMRAASEPTRPKIDKEQMKVVLKQALKELEEDLQEASQKYDLESELFAEVDFARVNAFTDNPFGGNPAAICYLPYQKEDEWLQRIAKEFGVTETAFLVKRRVVAEDESKGDGEDPVEFDLRWFTPKIEVDLCGHATLGAAHLLFFTLVEQDIIVFHTKSGILKARKVAGYEIPKEPETGPMVVGKPSRRSSGKGVVELDFPLVLAKSCSASEAAEVCNALGISSCIWCGKTDLGDYLVELSSSEDVKRVQPKFNDMINFPGRGGVIVTAQTLADTEFDFISRFFCPKSGILEDPVTGSAHCTLGPYWSKKLGKNRLEGYQASERGGRVTVRVDESEGRARLQGCSIMVMAGVLLNVAPPKESR